MNIRYISIPNLPDKIPLDWFDWSQDPPRLFTKKQFSQLIEMLNNEEISENDRISKNKLNEINSVIFNPEEEKNAAQYTPAFQAKLKD